MTITVFYGVFVSQPRGSRRAREQFSGCDFEKLAHQLLQDWFARMMEEEKATPEVTTCGKLMQAVGCQRLPAWKRFSEQED
jgi:hypothetical protein